MTDQIRKAICTLAPRFAVAGVLVVSAAGAAAAAKPATAATTPGTPVVSVMEPWGVPPGAGVEVTLTGKDLAGARIVWSTADAHFEAKAPKMAMAGSVLFKITAPAGMPVGVAALRVANADGVSKPALFMVDDLPTARGMGNNQTAEKAQRITPPAAVDGWCDVDMINYYRFAGKAGQSVSMEVVAQRLGSPLDAVIRLVGPTGRTVGECDDVEGVGADPQLTAVLPQDGDYMIEVHDARSTGGYDHAYRLRVGVPPMAMAPPPISLPVVAEVEPNDRIEQATKIAWPAVVKGSFGKAKDRDWLAFDVKKGTELRFTPLTQSLGSPAMIYMKLTDDAGMQLAEWVGASPKAEPLTRAFAAEGSYRLMLEELSRRGGDRFIYAVKIEEVGKDFLLNTADNTLNLAAGGTVKMKVNAVRRGYAGPIRLGIEGKPEWQLEPGVIEKDKTSADVTLTVPPDTEPGVQFVKLTGRGEDANTAVAVASTMPALNALWPGLRYPPLELDGQIAVGVTPKAAEKANLAAGPAEPAKAAVAGSDGKTDAAKKIEAK